MSLPEDRRGSAGDLLRAMELFDAEESMAAAIATEAGENHRLPKMVELARRLAAEPDHATAGAWSAYLDAIAAQHAQHTVNTVAAVAEAESLLDGQ